MVTNEEDVPRFSLRRGARFLETFPQEPEIGDSDEQWIADLREDPGADAPPYGPGDSDGDGPDGDAPDGESLQEAIELPSEAAEVHPDVEDDPELCVAPGAELPGELDPPTEGSAAPPQAGQESHAEPVSRARHQAEPIPGLNLAVATLTEHLANLEEALARTAAACTVARMVLGQGQALLDHPSHAPGAHASGEESAVVDVGDQVPPPPEPATTVSPRPRPGAHLHSSSETSRRSRLITPLHRYGSGTLRDLLRPE